MTERSVLEFLQSGGVLALLVLIIIAGSKRLWVWGWQYTKVVEERDEWRAMALKGTSLANKASDVTQEALDVERKRTEVLEAALLVLQSRPTRGKGR